MTARKHTQQRHHHNVFYNLQQDTIYMFGGYGAYSYYNKFLKFDPGKDNWETAVFSGDNITPRFFCGDGEVLIIMRRNIAFLGGLLMNCNQVVGGRQFYDLYRINLKTHVIKKCTSIRPPGTGKVFVFINNLILSPDKKYFYALCYPRGC